MGFQNLSNLSVTVVVNYVQSFGFMAPVVAFVLFAIQAALPVLPYIVLASAGGLLFGFRTGFLLAWAGALTGACLAYSISRWAAGNWAREKILTRWGYDLKQIDRETAFWSIVMARVIPVVPTPVINVVAGVGKVPFWSFFLSSAIGKIPTALLYTGLGISLFRNRDVKSTILILAAILLIAMGGRYWVRNRSEGFSKAE